jgi:hypothetical protein
VTFAVSYRAMKRAALLLSTAFFCACTTMSSGIFATQDVACGKTVLAYSNSEIFSERITIKAIDHCAGADSELQVVGTDGAVTQRYAIPDGATKSVTIVVPRGDAVKFACNGESGGCSYSLLGE